MPRGKSATALDENGLDLAGHAHRARERAPVRRDDRRFAGRIDVGQHERIDGREHLDEVLEQIARARVAMRLEREDEPPPGKASARGSDRRGHLDRVMTVVVDQRVGAAASTSTSP